MTLASFKRRTSLCVSNGSERIFGQLASVGGGSEFFAHGLGWEGVCIRIKRVLSCLRILCPKKEVIRPGSFEWVHIQMLCPGAKGSSPSEDFTKTQRRGRGSILASLPNIYGLHEPNDYAELPKESDTEGDQPNARTTSMAQAVNDPRGTNVSHLLLSRALDNDKPESDLPSKSLAQATQGCQSLWLTGFGVLALNCVCPRAPVLNLSVCPSHPTHSRTAWPICTLASIKWSHIFNCGMESLALI